MLRSISEQSRKSVKSVLIAVASRLVAGYSNPGSIHFFAGIGHGQAKIEFLFKSMHRLCSVHQLCARKPWCILTRQNLSKLS